MVSLPNNGKPKTAFYCCQGLVPESKKMCTVRDRNKQGRDVFSQPGLDLTSSSVRILSYLGQQVSKINKDKVRQQPKGEKR